MSKYYVTGYFKIGNVRKTKWPSATDRPSVYIIHKSLFYWHGLVPYLILFWSKLKHSEIMNGEINKLLHRFEVKRSTLKKLIWQVLLKGCLEPKYNGPLSQIMSSKQLPLRSGLKMPLSTSPCHLKANSHLLKPYIQNRTGEVVAHNT